MTLYKNKLVKKHSETQYSLHLDAHSMMGNKQQISDNLVSLDILTPELVEGFMNSVDKDGVGFIPENLLVMSNERSDGARVKKEKKNKNVHPVVVELAKYIKEKSGA